MRIEIDKEEYKDLIETKEEFLKTVRKLDNITIENIKLTDKLQEKELELIMAKADLCRGCQYKNDYKAKEPECELNRIRYKLDEISECEVENES